MPSTPPSTPFTTRRLLFAFGFLLLANCGIILAMHLEGEVLARGWKRVFNFDSESNLPTWFSTGLFFICAYHLWRNRTLADGLRRFWGLLAGIFAYLGIDELAQLHEKFNALGRWMVGYEEGQTGGEWLHHAWTIPYLLLFGVIGLLLLRDLRRLPHPTLTRFVAAGALFIFGAVVVEMVSGQYLAVHNKQIPYYFFTTLEESCEMLGLIAFSDAVLRYHRQLKT